MSTDDTNPVRLNMRKHIVDGTEGLQQVREEAGTKRVRLSVNNAADVHFEGRLLTEYTTQNRDGTKDRWTEIRLWETAGGTWIVESVGCSSRTGDAELRDVKVLEPTDREGDDEVDTLLRGERRKTMVIDFLGWTTVAKAFAKKAGWDVVRRVD